jgi:hypothetical protein
MCPKKVPTFLYMLHYIALDPHKTKKAYKRQYKVQLVHRHVAQELYYDPDTYFPLRAPKTNYFNVVQLGPGLPKNSLRILFILVSPSFFLGSG